MTLKQFQSTHPRRVRLSSGMTQRGQNIFQSTHPRRVRRLTACIQVQQLRISIHTPAKGATRISLTVGSYLKDFNPHTREGCDFLSSSALIAILNFNPHTREGCDECTGITAQRMGYFNPHTREGCDFRENGN